MARQRLVVYLNQGDGTYPVNPTWMSDDVDYHGHLDLADVDGDGNIDCAVGVYIGPGGFDYPGKAKLYRGLGDGTFSGFPIWESDDGFYCFSVAFGDLDMDGLPDLACATGDDYYDHPEHRRVYRNIGGQLEGLPSWTSTEYEYSLDVIWADFNGDGALDLAFAGTSNPNRIYFSESGVLQTTAGWSSADASVWANTAAAGDVDGDGWMDLAIADNLQLGGYGRAKVYGNLGNGSLSTVPTWQSNSGGFGSHVSFIDVDEDADYDLATGMWWGAVRVFENIGGSLTGEPAYQSATNSVIENEVWEDFDNDGLQSGLQASWIGDGLRRFFVFPERPVRELLSLTVDGTPVDLSQVSLDSDDGWMILPDVPDEYAAIRAGFVSSADVDLAVSNWDNHIGDYVFYNLRDPVAIDFASMDPGACALQLGPNPSSGPVRLWLSGRTEDSGGACEVFGPTGRRIATWTGTSGPILWDGRDDQNHEVAPGVYWVRWRVPGHGSYMAKVIRQ
jgi:hypothetical protein